jgi:hypothetical protein
MCMAVWAAKLNNLSYSERQRPHASIQERSMRLYSEGDTKKPTN